MAALIDDEVPLLGAGLRQRLAAGVLADVCGLGALEPLLADPEVTEIMVNGPGRVWVERNGSLARVPIDLDTPAIEHLIEKVVAPLGLRIDRSSPLVDARLPDGSRVNAVVPPLAVDGPCLTVRRFGARAVPLAAFAPPDVAALLARAVADRRNMVISGGTGAGKTTLLNALSSCIPPTSGSSPSRTRPSWRCRRSTSSASRPGRPTPRAPARSASATWSATPCACAPTASSSARSGARRRSTCSRP